MPSGTDARPRDARVVPTSSQASVPAVALVHPVAALGSQHITHPQADDVLGLLVTKLGWKNEAQRRAMLARQRPAVHLVAHQRLRMTGRRHVERLVVVVGAGDLDKASHGSGGCSASRAA